MDKPVAQRFFFALWPEPELAHTIWQATADLVPKGTGRRLVPEQLHITLAFLGQLEETHLACMTDAAGHVQGESFTLDLDEAGHFPRPQVVWVGASRVPVALQALQFQLVTQLNRQCGYQPEARAFLPHITLWRKVRRVTLPEQKPSLAWPVNRFVLARSRTLPSGAEYALVQEWPLNESGRD